MVTKRTTHPDRSLVCSTAVRIGTAGWAIPKGVNAEFAAYGSTLERYASRLNAVEINSSFHRPHRASTYERWADSVPDTFRFAVKMPKTITHDARLAPCRDDLETFLGQTRALGDRLGPILVQLPPSLAYGEVAAMRFFQVMRSMFEGAVVCEPRHASWFTHDANAVLREHRIARVAADPARIPEAAIPGGHRSLTYIRLHGSPDVYRSPYTDRLASLANVASEAFRAGRPCWILFDNTASGAATSDALALAQIVEEQAPGFLNASRSAS